MKRMVIVGGAMVVVALAYGAVLEAMSLPKTEKVLITCPGFILNYTIDEAMTTAQLKKEIYSLKQIPVESQHLYLFKSSWLAWAFGNEWIDLQDGAPVLGMMRNHALSKLILCTKVRGRLWQQPILD